MGKQSGESGSLGAGWFTGENGSGMGTKDDYGNVGFFNQNNQGFGSPFGSQFPLASSYGQRLSANRFYASMMPNVEELQRAYRQRLADEAWSRDQQKIQAARQAEAFNLFKGLLSGGSSGGGFMDFNQVQNLLNEGLTKRQGAYNANASNIQELIGNYKDDLSPNSRANFASREEAMQGLNNQFISGQRDLRSLQGRGVPAYSSQAQLADLINARLTAQKDIERGLAVDNRDRRQSLLGALNNLYFQDFGARMQTLGDTDLGAKYNAELQQANMQQKNTYLNMLQGYI